MQNHWIFCVCAPPPILVGAYYLHPSDARAISLHNEFPCKYTCSVTGGGGGGGGITYWGAHGKDANNYIQSSIY